MTECNHASLSITIDLFLLLAGQYLFRAINRQHDHWNLNLHRAGRRRVANARGINFAKRVCVLARTIKILKMIRKEIQGNGEKKIYDTRLFPKFWDEKKEKVIRQKLMFPQETKRTKKLFKI